VKTRHGLTALILIFSAWALPTNAAHAGMTLYNDAGFIQGEQSFTQSFDITTPGTLTVTLSSIPWLDTLSDLTCFLTTASGSIGSSMDGGTESISVGPGVIYAHWFGVASGSFDIGVFGLNIVFQPSNVTAVPLPASLLLLLSGLGVMLGWQRSKSAAVPAA